MLDRRTFTLSSLAFGASAITLSACGETSSATETNSTTEGKIEPMQTTDETMDWANLSRADWENRLTEEEFYVLRQEGTERPWSSELNDEKRAGTYVCAGCALPLFTQEMKFDSGTGWPSFFTTIEGAVDTKRDFKLLVPRTEYHCSRCGGHQGHVFKDGPRPTGKRFCNNGVALDFIPDEA